MVVRIIGEEEADVSDYSAFFLTSYYFPPPFIANFVQIENQFFCSYGYCINISPECRIMSLKINNKYAEITFSNSVKYEIPIGNSLFIKFLKNFVFYSKKGDSLFNTLFGLRRQSIPEPTAAIITMKEYFELLNIIPKENIFIEYPYEDTISLKKLHKKPRYYSRYRGYYVIIDEYIYSDVGGTPFRTVVENSAKSMVDV